MQSNQDFNQIPSTHFPKFPYPKVFHTLLILTAWIPWGFFQPQVPSTALFLFQLQHSFYLFKYSYCRSLAESVVIFSWIQSGSCYKVKLYGVLRLPSSRCTTCPRAWERRPEERRMAALCQPFILFYFAFYHHPLAEPQNTVLRHLSRSSRALRSVNCLGNHQLHITPVLLMVILLLACTANTNNVTFQKNHQHLYCT